MRKGRELTSPGFKGDATVLAFVSLGEAGRLNWEQVRILLCSGVLVFFWVYDCG